MKDYTALSLLQHDAICTVVLQDGVKRDAAWNRIERRFEFCDGMGEDSITADEIYEWWPAGAKS